MAFIEFKDVELTFQTKSQRINIFKDLNMDIEKGVLAVIYGPSGKGKSTLLNLVSGFLQPTKGNVIVDGVNIGKMSETDVCKYRNKRIGYIFQSFNLIQQFNVTENVTVPLLFAGKSKKEAVKKAEELLEQVGLQDRLKEYPRTLSGGEQQRVAFARAIANEPDIILADEPTGNLDGASGEKLIGMIRDLNREKGMTVLCVSHDTRVIELIGQEGIQGINIEDITYAK